VPVIRKGRLDDLDERRNLMGKKEAYQEKVQAQLREWKADIEKLMARADKAKAEGKIEFYKRAETLNAKYQAALKSSQEMKEAGEDKWEEFKAGVEAALEEVKDALKKNGASKPQ
jgi:hypothetical protein